MKPRNWIEQMPSTESYWINRVLYDVQHKPDHAARFKQDPVAYMAGMPLSQRAQDLLAANDIGQLYLIGSNPYLLRTHCLQLRVPEDEYLGALRAVAAEAYADE